MPYISNCPTCKRVTFTTSPIKQECEFCRRWYNVLFRQLKELLFPNMR